MPKKSKKRHHNKGGERSRAARKLRRALEQSEGGAVRLHCRRHGDDRERRALAVFCGGRRYEGQLCLEQLSRFASKDRSRVNDICLPECFPELACRCGITGMRVVVNDLCVSLHAASFEEEPDVVDLSGVDNVAEQTLDMDSVLLLADSDEELCSAEAAPSHRCAVSPAVSARIRRRGLKKTKARARRFGVRQQNAVPLGAIQPARPGFSSEECEKRLAVVRAKVDELRALGVREVFCMERMQDETVQCETAQCESSPRCKRCLRCLTQLALRQFRARFAAKAKPETAWGNGRLDISVRGLVARLEFLPQVAAGWQEYFARRLDSAVHEMVPIEELIDLAAFAFSIGIEVEWLPMDVPTDLPTEVSASLFRSMGEKLARAGREASHARENKVFARTITTQNNKRAHHNGGSPALSESKWPDEWGVGDVKVMLDSIAVYLTSTSPIRVRPRGGRHYSFLFGGAGNKYESIAVGVGSCGPHVDFFNDDCAPFDEMGALGYTFYSDSLGMWIRVFVFFYPRKCVRVFLDAWTKRFGGCLTDFDGEKFPCLPAGFLQQQAEFRQLYIDAAVSVLHRRWPVAAVPWAELVDFRPASCCSLDHKSANICGFHFNPVVAQWGRPYRLVFAVAAALCCAPTVAFGASVALPEPSVPTLARGGLLVRLVRFFVRNSKATADGGWSKWDFVKVPGEQHAQERTMRMKGMLQDLHARVRGDEEVAEEVLGALSDAIEAVRTALQGPRIKVVVTKKKSTSVDAWLLALKKFRMALKALRVGFGPLQMSNLTVNLFALGILELGAAATDEMLCGPWPGLGGGSRRALQLAGIDNAQQLRELVCEESEMSYGDDIFTEENVRGC